MKLYQKSSIIKYFRQNCYLLLFNSAKATCVFQGIKWLLIRYLWPNLKSYSRRRKYITSSIIMYLYLLYYSSISVKYVFWAIQWLLVSHLGYQHFKWSTLCPSHTWCPCKNDDISTSHFWGITLDGWTEGWMEA